MQDQEMPKRTFIQSATRIAGIIFVILLLSAMSYMAFVEIDKQATSDPSALLW